MDKSYVTLEQHVCRVCGVSFDSGNLLMDTRLRKRFDHKTSTGWGMCAEHQKLADEGFVALVEAKDSGRNNLKPEEADRTGRLAHIKVAAFQRVINTPVPEGKVCFISPEAFNRIIEMSGAAP